MSISDINKKAARFEQAAKLERQTSPDIVQQTGAVRRQGLRRAFCKTPAGSGSTIVCYLDKDGSGDEITVYCDIVGWSPPETPALNSALPRLEDGTPLTVWNNNGTWHCLTLFQVSRDC